VKRFGVAPLEELVDDGRASRAGLALAGAVVKHADMEVADVDLLAEFVASEHLAIAEATFAVDRPLRHSRGTSLPFH